MKKLLFALLASAAITPAMAQDWGYAQGRAAAPQQRTYQQRTYQQQTVRTTAPATRPVAQQQAQVRQPAPKSDYRLGNPMGRPAAGGVFLTAEASYYYTPKEEVIGQDKMTGWTVDPSAEIGLTDKLSVLFGAQYGQFKIKSDLNGVKGAKSIGYAADVALRYLLASADGFDFNVMAGLHYEKDRVHFRNIHRTASRNTGTDIALQVGKKIENITPYFTVGFDSDFWSKRGSSNGTSTYINPGVYIDMTDCLSLDLNYWSETHGDAEYRASLDVYPTDNVMLGLGGFIRHPETDKDTYGATATVKFAF